MDRSRAPPVPCRLDARPALARPRRADAQSVSADAHLDRVGGSASTDDNHFPKPHSLWQKNRRSRGPVFSPCTLAGRKFQSCARQRKRFLQSSDRVSPVRDTSFQRAEEVRASSCTKVKRSQQL